MINRSGKTPNEGLVHKKTLGGPRAKDKNKNYEQTIFYRFLSLKEHCKITKYLRKMLPLLPLKFRKLFLRQQEYKVSSGRSSTCLRHLRGSLAR